MMDHAEAHERIADLALDRAALQRLRDGTPEVRAFLDHVAGCPACTADLRATRSLDRGLRDALAEVGDVTAIAPINLPESLREAVLDAARREPAPGASSSPMASTTPRASTAAPRRWALVLLRLSGSQWAAALAAAVVIAVVGGLTGRALTPAPEGRPDASMVAAVATLDRVLAAPDHHLATLRTPAGTASGSVAWSSQDFVVLTSALSTPAPDQVYRCWLQWAGEWTAVGSMEFAGTTAYWAGSVGDWASLLGDPATRFVVTAEAPGPVGTAPAGAVLLQAAIGS